MEDGEDGQQRQTRSARQAARVEFRKKNPFRGWLRAVTSNQGFDTFFAFVVVVSVVAIGWEVEVTAQDPVRYKDAFLVFQAACCLLFFIELFFRVGASGIRFFIGKDHKWNLFDFFCWVAMVADVIAEFITLEKTKSMAANGLAETTTSGRIVRVLRLMRIMRALRIMRATRTSREFKKMSYALQYSATTLFWALLLLGFVMYFFATAFTQAVVDAVREDKEKAQLMIDFNPGEEHDMHMKSLINFYGTIPKAFLSLFMAISSGRDWEELITPVQAKLHPGFVFLFICFIAVTTFGIMNVLTSVFVESALQSVQHYKDLLIEESMKKKQMFMDHLLAVFRQIDEDQSGSISLQEMESFLDEPELVNYLQSMDIMADDARMLFRLLDKDDSENVSIEEFCNGCLRLKGEAKSFDIHCIIYENQRLLFKCKELMQFMEDGLISAISCVVDNALREAAAMGKQEPAAPVGRSPLTPPTLPAQPHQQQQVPPRVSSESAPECQPENPPMSARGCWRSAGTEQRRTCF